MQWLTENWILLLPIAVFVGLFFFRRQPSPAESGGCCAGVEREARGHAGSRD